MNRNDSRFGTVEAVKKIGISFERLRYWEHRGIVKPEYVQCGTREFRRYSEKDVHRALLVRVLVDEEKYSLEGAMSILKKSDGEGNTYSG